MTDWHFDIISYTLGNLQGSIVVAIILIGWMWRHDR